MSPARVLAKLSAAIRVAMLNRPSDDDLARLAGRAGVLLCLRCNQYSELVEDKPTKCSVCDASRLGYSGSLAAARDGADGAPEGHYAECPHCCHDPRRVEVEKRLLRREHNDRSAIVRAGGDWPAHQVAVRNVLGSVMHLWRGRMIDLEVLDFAVAAVHLGAAVALLGRDELCDVDDVRALRELLLRTVDERMLAAPSTVTDGATENSVHGPTGPCTGQPVNPNKPNLDP